MFFNVWDWAGKLRFTQTIPCVRPYLIAQSLESLCLDVQYWCSEDCDSTFIEQSAIIHPFPNGNGRFSRLIADRYLKAFKCSYPNWPTNIGIEGEYRKQYIQALKKADQGDYFSLVSYMKKYGAKDIVFS